MLRGSVNAKSINQLAATSRGEPAVRTLPPVMRTSAWKLLLAFYIAQAGLGVAIGLAVPWIVWFQS
jgi:hypothetical protein